MSSSWVQSPRPLQMARATPWSLPGTLSSSQPQRWGCATGVPHGSPHAVEVFGIESPVGCRVKVHNQVFQTCVWGVPYTVSHALPSTLWMALSSAFPGPAQLQCKNHKRFRSLSIGKIRRTNYPPRLSSWASGFPSLS